MEVEIGELSRGAGSSIFVTGDSRLTHSDWTEDHLSSTLRSHVEDAALSVTNLEASVAAGDPLVKTGPTLATPETTHRLLADLGFDAVSLANNHTMDYGRAGLEATKEACAAADLDTVGAGADAQEAIEPLRYEIDGTSIGIFAVTEHEEALATETTPGTCWARTPGISAAIQRHSMNLDVTIVLAHGGVEYVPFPSEAWRRLLRGFARLDVDAVVGHHPHCPQPWETCNGTPILYSLGDFLMITDVPASLRSYGVDLVVGNGQLDAVRVIPFETSDGTVEVVSESRRPGYHRYLSETADRLQSGDHESYWQELAVRLFDRKYEPRFGEYGLGPAAALLAYPIRELDRITRGCLGACARREKAANLVDYLGNESHRDVVTTAIQLRIGNSAEIRSETAAHDLDRWYPYYDGRPSRSRVEAYSSRLRTVVRRLS